MLSTSVLGELILSLLLITDGYAASTSIDDACLSTANDQSPIDILSDYTHLLPGGQPFVFVNYPSTKLSVEFDDHTVKLKPTSTHKVGLAAGGIRGFYVLDNIHFHWGSEHTINGERFAFEAHFVHYNEMYPNVQAALSDAYGIAVIGVLFNEGARNDNIDDVMEGAKQVGSVRGPVKLDLTPEQLLPLDKSSFYRYHGSLTTPPCTDSVIWSVFNSTLTLAPNQIEWFKNAPLTHGALKSNYRRVQDTSYYRYVELWKVSYSNCGFLQLPSNSFLWTLLSIYMFII